MQEPEVVGNYKESVSSGQIRAAVHMNTTVVMIIQTRHVQAKERSNPGMEKGDGHKVLPLFEGYWQLLAAMSVNTSFL